MIERRALIDGIVVPYDMCSTVPFEKKAWDRIEFIGKGVIYSLNGILANDERDMYFYAYPVIDADRG